MTGEGANSAIKLSALVVGGTYLYRRLTEGSAEELKASTKIAPLGNFIVGWGFVFLTLSVLAPAAPGLAGHTALLLMVASLLANGIQIGTDLQTALKKPVEEREAMLHPKGRRGAPRRGATVPQQPQPGEAP